MVSRSPYNNGGEQQKGLPCNRGMPANVPPLGVAVMMAARTKAAWPLFRQTKYTVVGMGPRQSKGPQKPQGTNSKQANAHKMLVLPAFCEVHRQGQTGPAPVPPAVTAADPKKPADASGVSPKSREEIPKTRAPSAAREGSTTNATKEKAKHVGKPAARVKGKCGWGRGRM